MQLFEQGKAYWEIMLRFNQHRNTLPAVVPSAIRDMQRLRAQTTCDPVRRRIDSFIARYGPRSPSPTNIA